MILSFNSSDLLHAWVWAMIHSIWIGLTLAFMYYAYLSLSHTASARAKYTVGMTLFILLPVGCLIAFIASIPAQAQLAANTIADLPGATAVSFNTGIVEAVPAENFYTQRINHYLPSLFTIWCLGVILLSIKMIAGYREITVLRNRATIINDLELKALFETLLNKSGLKQSIQLASSSRIDIPITLGHLRPIVLLPISLMNQLSPDETYAILAHELAHIMRRDYLQNLLISLTEILFFFHPSVWWFASTIKSIREQCCDDIALSLGAERMALSKALITLEEQPGAPLFAMAFSHKNQLLHRIQRLFDIRSTNEFTMSRGQAPILICSLAILWLLSSAWHPATEWINKTTNKMPLAKSFLWDPGARADTAKPKIEKITKDNGKRKLELSLEDKKIKELKVDNQIISPKEYDKYAAETEALTKELKEIEMPESPRQARVYNDFYNPGTSGSYSYSYSSDDDSDKVMGSEFNPQSRYRNYSYDRARSNPDSRPRVYEWNDGEMMGHSPIILKNKMSKDMAEKLKNKFKGFSYSGPGDNIKYIIEGDSTGLVIDGDKLIIKNDKGDVIIDFNDGDGRGLSYSNGWAKGWSGSPRRFYFPGDAYVRGYGQGLEKLEDLSRLKELKGFLKEDMLRQKWNDEEFHNKLKDELKESGEWREEFDDKLKSELDRSNKLIEKLKFKNKSLLDDQEMKHLKQLKELEHNKHLDEWRDKTFFKDGQGFNLLSGNGKMDQIIQEHLVDDQIIKPGESYEFKISSGELKVNGKKQSSKMYEKYKSIIEDATGVQMKGNTNFVFSGSGKKD
jgi:beta-lactamase regulating signal transducer with metallopeptidase domain